MTSNHRKELDAAYKKKVLGVLEAAVKKTALSVDRELVLETPVGNPDLWQSPAPPGYSGGRARANWFASINIPRSDTTESTDRDSSNTVQAVLGEYNLGDTIFITNNLPYIQRLNDGWSTQAPAGFVDDVVSRNRRKAAEIGRLINA